MKHAKSFSHAATWKVSRGSGAGGGVPNLGVYIFGVLYTSIL